MRGGCEDGLRSASGWRKLALQDSIPGDVDECEEGRGQGQDAQNMPHVSMNLEACVGGRGRGSCGRWM